MHSSKGNITLVPVGGLSNRLWSIASAVALADHCHMPLRIYWFRDAGLNCRFDQLFQPIVHEEVTLIEASAQQRLYDRPRRKNFWLPALWQDLAFSRRMYEDDERLLKDNHFDFPQWVGDSRCYIASFRRFFPYPDDACRSLFRPTSELQQRIDQVTAQFTPRTIGIHLRRTDHTFSLQESPLYLFEQTIESEIAQDANVNFYLATDSEEDKRHLRERYGNRILTYNCPLTRGSLQGMQAAVVELWALSRTREIIGSHRSTYSQLAAELTNIPCHMLRKSQQS